MHIRPNTLVLDDVDDIHVTASSAEPFQKPDHKSKKHARPARKSETLGGGHFVFRRHADGRIHPRQEPFEHGTHDAAATEASRLAAEHGGMFEVYSRVGGASDADLKLVDKFVVPENDAATGWPSPDYVDMECGPVTIDWSAIDEGGLVEALSGLGPVDDIEEYTDAEIVNGYYGPQGGAA